MPIIISFEEFCEFMYEALTDFGYLPTEREIEVIVSLALDFFLEKVNFAEVD
jgi:hypothetical protein